MKPKCIHCGKRCVKPIAMRNPAGGSICHLNRPESWYWCSQLCAVRWAWERVWTWEWSTKDKRWKDEEERLQEDRNT